MSRGVGGTRCLIVRALTLCDHDSPEIITSPHLHPAGDCSCCVLLSVFAEDKSTAQPVMFLSQRSVFVTSLILRAIGLH